MSSGLPRKGVCPLHLSSSQVIVCSPSWLIYIYWDGISISMRILRYAKLQLNDKTAIYLCLTICRQQSGIPDPYLLFSIRRHFHSKRGREKYVGQWFNNCRMYQLLSVDMIISSFAKLWMAAFSDFLEVLIYLSTENCRCAFFVINMRTLYIFKSYTGLKST